MSTNTNANTEQFCNQCKNHCPATDLQCGRGKRLFGQEEAHAGADFDPESLMGLLRRCGHMLHHGDQELSEEKLFAALSDEERGTLRALLQKAAADWPTRGRHR